MAHLRQQFKDALSAIEPGADKENAPRAHQSVRAALQADKTLADYGADPVLIGSYKRSVSIRRIKDVDVFVRLPNMPDSVTSTEILDCFFTALNSEFGRDPDGHRRVRRQARSLAVAFPEFDLDVDAVPARQYWDGETWEIPEKGDADKWVHTNPEELTSLSSGMNAAHEGFYVPTVKLLRQTRRALLGKSKPSGFFFEMATYEAFRSGVVTGDDQAEYYVSALAAVSALLNNFVSYGIGIPDPTLPGKTIIVRATDEEWNRAADGFASAAIDGQAALDEDDEGRAARLFQSLLGNNGDGDKVFPMPPGFDDNGEKLALGITPGDRAVPAGKRTFG